MTPDASPRRIRIVTEMSITRSPGGQGQDREEDFPITRAVFRVSAFWKPAVGGLSSHNKEERLGKKNEVTTGSNRGTSARELVLHP
ncbi:hypothetical protein RRG08_025597 [Elysia crispata]|uniref:Uncharacterized protein n=1 Tax=Elysia crispata TaxID=231223 RepID=A0AAE0YE14_9GAST|nr:hypothetical protein RRG08_025597 [Elysia crispata]